MSACIALLIPITTTLAASLQMNPVVFGLIVGIVVDAVILYPVQTATNLLAYETGLIQGKDVLKVGLGTLVITSLVILFIALPGWSLLRSSTNHQIILATEDKARQSKSIHSSNVFYCRGNPCGCPSCGRPLGAAPAFFP